MRLPLPRFFASIWVEGPRSRKSKVPSESNSLFVENLQKICRRFSIFQDFKKFSTDLFKGRRVMVKSSICIPFFKRRPSLSWTQDVADVGPSGSRWLENPKKSSFEKKLKDTDHHQTAVNGWCSMMLQVEVLDATVFFQHPKTRLVVRLSYQKWSAFCSLECLHLSNLGKNRSLWKTLQLIF